MSISKKLYYGFGSILGVVLLLFIINFILSSHSKTVKEAMKGAFDTAYATQAIRSQMSENDLNVRNFLLSGVAADADKVNAGAMRVSELISHAAEKASNDQRAELAKVQTAENNWGEHFAKPLIEKRRQVDSGNTTVSDLQIFYLTLNPAEWQKNTFQDLDETDKAGIRLMEDLRKQDESASTAAAVVGWLGLAVMITLGFLIAKYTAESITKPLFHMIMVARDISESGDLDQKLEIDSQDEIGELGRAFSNMVAYLKEMAAVSEAIAGGDLTVAVEPRSKSDTLAVAFGRMTEGLRHLVRSVRDSASQVSSGSTQVADASEDAAKVSVQAASAIDEVTSTMHEMSINVQNMVKNTQTQASSVSETSASIDQMVASIQRVADTAKVLLDISHRSREEVQSGIGTMEKATDGLNKINASIHSSGEIIDALGQRADDIGKIIEVIDDLAEQTNLLALNAAIEAARAGEHGLGFAVVADEVRKLAEKSASATKEISELIQSIQKEARKAVDNMDKSTGIVNEGLTFGTDLNTALKKISNVVTEVYKFAQEIGAATNEQSHGSSQIAKATTRLNEITHEINSSVEEQASGAQAVVRAMEKMRELVQQSTSGSTELAASAEQMSKMSQKLLHAMDTFVTETTNGAGRGRSGRTEGEDLRSSGTRYAAAARS